MKMAMQSAAALAALLAAAPAAAEESWYASADAGYNAAGGLDFATNGDVAPPFAGEHDFEDSWSASAALGRELPNNLRLEAEVAVRRGDLEGGGVTAPAGEAEAMSALANLYYDFNRGGRLQPYGGVGAGFARVDAEARLSPNLIPEDSSAFSDDDTVFAYQLTAGIGIALSERVMLDLNYRFFAANDLEFSGHFETAPAVFETDLDLHTVSAGLRWRFGD